ncbi:MAG: UDP-N-acetylmuramoyl-tripeptide--D-alanyl-D-alanine ligase [Burkholderiales bacterium]|nr:UDP-N-acetylmuramoyl-tripeptide--D-alanyl-D-alanine ligase [Burkholderiales bacterium]
MTLAEAHALLPASRVVGAPTIRFERVHSDTRTLQPGDLFVALRGEHFDGHDFLREAQAAGAVAALAERGLSSALPGLEVADTLAALQQLAAAWRARMTLPLVAVTGSNGKTTVTQMTAAILRAWLGEAALATQGNLNNHIGVPLTLLRLRRDEPAGAGPAPLPHRAAVLELGMNHVGEIALLARLAQPTIAVIVNAQREHQEFMAGVEAVARENGNVIDALGADGIVVVPARDAYAALWRRAAGARRVVGFGVDAPADVVAHGAWDAARGAWQLQLATPQGAARTTLHQAGRHNLHNAAAAAAAALAAGAPLAAVERGLAAFEPVAGRSRTLPLTWRGRAATLVDDSYNANPDSVRAAIDLLADLPGPRWLLLGDMGEVGAQGAQFHAEVGAHARARGIETVWAAGLLSAQVGADRHFADTAALAAALREGPAAASLLVKGSRFMRMEQVVAALQAMQRDAPAGSAHAA